MNQEPSTRTTWMATVAAQLQRDDERIVSSSFEQHIGRLLLHSKRGEMAASREPKSTKDLEKTVLLPLYETSSHERKNR